MDHLEAIVEIKKVVSPEFINKIIPLINHKAKENLFIEKGLDKNIRNVKGYHLNFNTPTNLFYWNYIKKEIERLYLMYKGKFTKMDSSFMYPHGIQPITKGTRYSIVAWLQ